MNRPSRSDSQIFRVLLIEDNPGDARLIRELLKESNGMGEQFLHSQTLGDGLDILEEAEVDIILLDLSLPDSSGLQTVQKIQLRAPALPIIVLTGLDDRDLALRVIQNGCQDYLIKGEFDGKLLNRSMRYAFERKEAEETLQRKVRELDALHVAAKMLAGHLDVNDLARDVSRTMVEDFGVKIAGVFHAEPGGEFSLLSSYPVHLEYPRLITLRWDNSPLAQGPAGRSVKSGLPVIIKNISSDPLFSPWCAQAKACGIQSVAAFPLLSRGSAFATLVLYSDLPDFFNEERTAFFQSYAQLLAAALENARLFSRTERHLKQLSALRNIDMAITSSLDLRVTLNVILDNVATQLEVDATDILLLDPLSQTLEFAAERGFTSKLIKHTSLKVGDGYAGRVARDRHVINISNLSENGDGFDREALVREEGFVTYFGVPLIAKGHIKGILEIFQRSPLQPENGWLDFLEALAGQAAIAIDNAALYDDLDRANSELILAYESTIEGWAKALDYRDKETEGHSRRVTEMAVKIAKEMGIRNEDLLHLRRGALLHDIGKLGVPDNILLKSGKLTEEEWRIMKNHPVIAYQLLSPISYLRPAIPIPYCHHEKWDGSGYPRGLKRDQIPLAARIFAIVDVWDALNSDRPYRPAWPHEEIVQYLRKEAGKHFDPEIVEIFLQMEW